MATPRIDLARRSEAPAPAPERARWPGRARLLLASDDSAMARIGEEWARRLRWASPPVVEVLTVARDAPEVPWFFRLGVQSYRTAVREAMAASRDVQLMEALRIANGVGERLQADGLDVHVWARQGNPADEIAAMTRLERIELVVVSPCGRSPHARLWDPCTAGEVARQVDVPVLLARGTPATDVPRHILILAAGDAASDAIGWLREMGWSRDARVSLAWVGDGGGAERTTVPRVHAVDPWLADGASVIGVARTIRSAGDAVQLAQEVEADLVVVPGDRTAFTREVAERATHESGASVLVAAAGFQPASLVARRRVPG